MPHRLAIVWIAIHLLDRFWGRVDIALFPERLEIAVVDCLIRRMVESDRQSVAELICVSTNYWYEQHGLERIFPDGPESADVFYQVYSALEGSVGIVAEVGGRLAGSCFYHQRPPHVSLGIMNAHPNYFGRGVARRLLDHINEVADGLRRPIRLVSSALNLDSFSLYTRAGFVPRCAYQDIALRVPEAGLEDQSPVVVREAVLDDVEAMAALEMDLCGIRREGDFRHFITNPDGFWHVSVCEDSQGHVSGFIAASGEMLGPGVARSEEEIAALLLAELNRVRGNKVIFLLPVECAGLVRRIYGWGGRNCELHFSQVRGKYRVCTGVNLPAFMPETG